MNPETVEEAVQLAKDIVEAAKTSKAQVTCICRNLVSIPSSYLKYNDDGSKALRGRVDNL